MKKVTTKDLEIAVLQYDKQAELRSLRTSLPWECDVLSVTKSGYATEYELKISKSDFKADFKKRKHKMFSKGEGGMVSRFWFVVPKDMVDKKDIPQYAGLMYYDHKRRTVHPVKYPQRLKAGKLDSKTIRRLYRSMMYRFLQLNFKGYRKVTF